MGLLMEIGKKSLDIAKSMYKWYTTNIVLNLQM